MCIKSIFFRIEDYSETDDSAAELISISFGTDTQKTIITCLPEQLWELKCAIDEHFRNDTYIMKPRPTTEELIDEIKKNIENGHSWVNKCE